METKCGEFVVPEEHLTACSTCNSRGRECGLKEEEGEGVDDVDFLLYVSARDTKQCGGKIGEGNFHILSKAVRLPGLRAKVSIYSGLSLSTADLTNALADLRLERGLRRR